jgi:hypothetical protein
MTTVTILLDDVGEIYRILEGLDNIGYTVHKDFSWTYNPSVWDNVYQTMSNRYVEFECTDDIATWILLKYGSKI